MRGSVASAASRFARLREIIATFAPFGEERGRAREADALAGPGDEDDTIGEAEIHESAFEGGASRDRRMVAEGALAFGLGWRQARSSPIMAGETHGRGRSCTRSSFVAALALGLMLAADGLAGPREDAAAAMQQRDYLTALRLYRSLAEQGDAEAQVVLGEVHAGGKILPKDDAEAVRWFRMAAEQGNARAQAHLGFMYVYGRGVPKDEALALEWTRKSADQGHPGGQNGLSWLYFNGIGVPKDVAEALKWMRMAAAQNLAAAQSGLGRRLRRWDRCGAERC